MHRNEQLHPYFISKEDVSFEYVSWSRTVGSKYTHGLIKLFIAAMAYYINTLDSQSSGRGRGGPNYFKVGDLF